MLTAEGYKVEKLRFSILYVTTARGAHKRIGRDPLVNHPDQSFPLWTPRRGRHTRAVLSVANSLYRLGHSVSRISTACGEGLSLNFSLVPHGCVYRGN